MCHVVKISVSIPRDIHERLNSLMKEIGVDNKSKMITEAIIHYLSKMRWVLGKGKIVGSILLLYNHTRNGIVQKITDLQHDYLDIIKSTMHIHVSEELCFESISVLGDVNRIKKLVSDLCKIKGIIKVEACFIPIP